MIQAICADCQYVFMAAVVMGPVKCPECGSDQIHVAIRKVVE